MNKKILTAALLGGLAFAQAASAQEFDDRWYLTGSAGFNFQDSDRLTNDAPFVTLGLGKFISPNWSLDGELNYQNPNFDSNQDLNWSQYGVSLDLRRHFIKEGRGWNPYIVGGLGYQKSEEEYAAIDNNGPRQRGTATWPPSWASACRPPSRSAWLSAPKWPTALTSTTRASLHATKAGSATCWLRSAS